MEQPIRWKTEIHFLVFILCMGIFYSTTQQPIAYAEGDSTAQTQACSGLVQEAENGMTYGDFTIGFDERASGGQFIHVPEEFPDSDLELGQRVDYCFNITETATYNLKGWMHSLHDGSDSFFVRITGVAEAQDRWFPRPSVTYDYNYFEREQEFLLTAGQQVTVSIFLREAGTRLDKLELEKVAGIVDQDVCGSLIQEAEDGVLSGNFVVGTDGAASSGQYIHVPDGTGDALGGPDPAHRAEYCFNVPKYGTYRLKGQVYADSTSNDSFFVHVDDVPAAGYLWTVTSTAAYATDTLSDFTSGQDPVDLVLSAGNHVVTVFLREDGTRLDKLELEEVIPAITDPGVGCTTSLIQEAEDGDLYGAFTTGVDGATTYVHVPEGFGTRYNADRTQRAEYCFDIQTAGTYRIKGAVYAPDANSDSFTVQFDGNPSIVQLVGDPPVGYTWIAQQNTSYTTDVVNDGNKPDGSIIDPVEIMLSEGQHQIAFFLREDGARLDKVELELVSPFTTPSLVCTTGLEQEAEDVALYGNYTIVDDGEASQGLYVDYLEGVGDRVSPDEIQKMRFCFDVAVTDTYLIRGWIGGETSGQDSFFAKVDDTPVNGYGWDIPQHGRFRDDIDQDGTPDPVYINDGVDTLDPDTYDEPIPVTLTAGQHIIDIYLREDGTRMDRLRLVPTSPTTCSTDLVQEGEDGTMFGAFVTGTDGAASGGEYVHVPDGFGFSGTPDPANRVDYCFEVATAGTYQIKGNVYAGDSSSDSFFIQVDGAPVNGQKWFLPINTVYQEDTSPLEVTLAPGQHTVSIFHREDGARLDTIELKLLGGSPPPPPICVNGLFQEAENGSLGGAFVVGNDGAASGGQYVHTPEGTGFRGSIDVNQQVAYCFDVPNAGTYQIQAGVTAADASSDSVYIQVDDEPVDGQKWFLPINTSYLTATAPLEVTLTPGEHTVRVFLREDGARLDTIALVPSGGPPPPPTCTTASVQEAEDGSLGGAFEIGNDAGASGSQYVHVPNGFGNRDPLDVSQQVAYCFTVGITGTYEITGNVYALDSSSDSFFVQINDQPVNGQKWFLPNNTSYQEDTAPLVVNLAPGDHTVRVFLREDGARLDRIALVPVTGSSASIQTLGIVSQVNNQVNGQGSELIDDREEAILFRHIYLPIIGR